MSAPAIVLLVDDDFDSRLIYGRSLAAAGYSVMEAVTGEQAVDIAHAVAPDIVILDLGLPDLDGLQVTEALRADPATQDALIIVLTAYVSPTDADLAMQAGCDFYVGKPILPKDLVNLVTEAASGEVPAPIRVGPLGPLVPALRRSRGGRPREVSRPMPPRCP